MRKWLKTRGRVKEFFHAHPNFRVRGKNPVMYLSLSPPIHATVTEARTYAKPAVTVSAIWQ